MDRNRPLSEERKLDNAGFRIELCLRQISRTLTSGDQGQVTLLLSDLDYLVSDHYQPEKMEKAGWRPVMSLHREDNMLTKVADLHPQLAAETDLLSEYAAACLASTFIGRRFPAFVRSCRPVHLAYLVDIYNSDRSTLEQRIARPVSLAGTGIVGQLQKRILASRREADRRKNLATLNMIRMSPSPGYLQSVARRLITRAADDLHDPLYASPLKQEEFLPLVRDVGRCSLTAGTGLQKHVELAINDPKMPVEISAGRAFG